MGPPTAKVNPNYREVCGGDTGHVEVYIFMGSLSTLYLEL